jgi:hypothetical protein
MTITEQRILILSALCNHFGKHRINRGRLVEYLQQNGLGDQDRIQDLLDEFERANQVMHITGTTINDYQITAVGEERLDTLTQSQPLPTQTTHVTVHTGGGSIIGSAIGNQGQRDLRLEGINNTTTLEIADSNIAPPNDKPDGWFKKSINWCIKNMGKIIIGVIIFIISWFLNIYFEKNKPKHPTETKLPVDSVKKH